MQLTPRYDSPPPLEMHLPEADVSEPLLRQRRRLADVLAGLTDDQWSAPSRCDQWTVQDVVAHLVGTNRFWAASIGAGLAGAPTRVLATFDPVKTPASMVAGMRTMTPADVLAGYADSLEALAVAVAEIDGPAWSKLAEAPPGHVSLSAVALHALWDSWTHERDIMLPLGLEPAVEPDEVAGCLRYSAAVGPALLASTGSTRRAALAVVASDPDLSIVVEAGPTVVVRDGEPPAGAPRLAGDAVALVEGLTLRAPLEPGLAEEDRWLLGGLAAAFDASVGSPLA